MAMALSNTTVAFLFVSFLESQITRTNALWEALRAKPLEKEIGTINLDHISDWVECLN
jgi:hypothetical protein